MDVAEAKAEINPALLTRAQLEVSDLPDAKAVYERNKLLTRRIRATQQLQGMQVSSISMELKQRVPPGTLVRLSLKKGGTVAFHRQQNGELLQYRELPPDAELPDSDPTTNPKNTPTYYQANDAYWRSKLNPQWVADIRRANGLALDFGLEQPKRQPYQFSWLTKSQLTFMVGALMWVDRWAGFFAGTMDKLEDGWNSTRTSIALALCREAGMTQRRAMLSNKMRHTKQRQVKSNPCSALLQRLAAAKSSVASSPSESMAELDESRATRKRRRKKKHRREHSASPTPGAGTPIAESTKATEEEVEDSLKVFVTKHTAKLRKSGGKQLCRQVFSVLYGDSEWKPALLSWWRSASKLGDCDYEDFEFFFSNAIVPLLSDSQAGPADAAAEEQDSADRAILETCLTPADLQSASVSSKRRLSEAQASDEPAARLAQATIEDYATSVASKSSRKRRKKKNK